MEELIIFIVRQKQTFNTRQTTHVIDINNLNDKQSVVYHMIEQWSTEPNSIRNSWNIFNSMC